MSAAVAAIVRGTAPAALSSPLLAQSPAPPLGAAGAPPALGSTSAATSGLRFGRYGLRCVGGQATGRGERRIATLTRPWTSVRAHCEARPKIRWIGLRFQVLDAPAFRGRTTSASVDWYTVGSASSAQEVELLIDGQRRRLITCSRRPTFSGKLRMDGPATLVRRTGTLEVMMLAEAQCPGSDIANLARIDALDIGISS